MNRKKSEMDADQLIDRFVEKVNSSPREPLSLEDVPAELRIGPIIDSYWTDWRIQRTEGIDWIKPYEDQLSAPLPPIFRSLVTRHIYPELETGDLWLFANTGLDIMHEWCTAVDVNDKKDYLTQMLNANGYIQFARPSGGSYDPICFDTKQKSGIGEYPIIWIDHEGILCHDKIRIVKEVADSFHQFVEIYLTTGETL